MKHFEGYTAENNNQGMTLVELMVCVAITAVVMTISLSFFFTQYKSQHGRKQMSDIQETTPAVLEMMKRDLQQAGWSVFSSIAFHFMDGGTDGSDRIFINDSSIIDLTNDAGRFANNDEPGCGAIENSENKLAPVSDLAVGHDPLYLDDDPGEEDASIDFSAGTFHYVITDNAADAKKVVRVKETPEGGKLELEDMANNDVSLESGDHVAPAVAYWIDQIDGRPVLLRSDRNSKDEIESLILAEDVVDLQVEYQDQSETWHTDATGAWKDDGTGSWNNVQMVRLTLLTRSRDKVGNKSSCMPLTLANRNDYGCGEQEKCGCGYVYKTYQVEINPRNV